MNNIFEKNIITYLMEFFLVVEKNFVHFIFLYFPSNFGNFFLRNDYLRLKELNCFNFVNFVKFNLKFNCNSY